MKKAILITDQLKGFLGDAALYRVVPPMMGLDGTQHHRIIVSAVCAFGGEPETYIFPARPDADEVESWGELEGSLKGTLNHAEALKAAGYVIIQERKDDGKAKT